MIETLYELFIKSSGISTDSRTIKGDEIFFALKGDNMDGNLYAEKAVEAGALCAVVDKKSVIGIKASENSDEYSSFFPVENTLDTLQRLASFHRNHFNIPVIALTGTNGKTTTKELISAVLSKKYKVHSTKGNFNNHIGVPLTLLNMEKKCKIAVIEMGASAKGEIHALCNIARPTHGLITNVAKAHLLGFGSFEGVKQAKGELYDYLLSSGGTAFYDEENPDLKQMIEQRKGINSIPYGIDRLGIRVSEAPSKDPCLTIRIDNGSRGKEIRSKLVGDYNLHNIATAISIGEFFNVSAGKIRSAIENYTPSNNRSQLTKTGCNTLIVDAYNANPASMKASIENFLKNSAEHKMVILGEMRELGEYSEDEHVAILQLLSQSTLEPEEIFLVGEEFSKAYQRYNKENKGRFSDKKLFCDIEELKKYFELHKPHGRTILIKGSNGVGLFNLPGLL